jgi:membrane fusion protein (multidrug efflux system)
VGRAAVIACVLALLPLTGCGSEKGDEAKPDGDEAKAGAKEGGRRPGGRPGGGRPGGRRGAWGGGPPSDAEAPKIPVIATRAERDDMEAFLDASSTLIAEENVDVVSQATGVVVELLAEEGDPIRKDGTLARLAYEELELAERRARAELDKLQADFARAESLDREKLISKEEYQQVRFDFDRAEIDWQQTKLELTRTRISAPISGTVTERMINVGQLVQTNAVVYRVVDFNSLVAPIFVPEKYLGSLRVGQKATIRPRGLDAGVKGHILRISPIVDSQSGTVKVTVALDERSALRPGMFAGVQVVLDAHSDVVVVPKKSLVFDDEEPHVFVVSEGAAARRRLTLGYQDAERVEVVDGLDAGEMVVLVGQSALKDGSQVEIQSPEGGGSAAATMADGAAPKATSGSSR